MVWSLQLTWWALPAFLAALLSVRDATYLWPRRRESGALPLAVLATLTGFWSAAQLVGIVTRSLSMSSVMLRGTFVIAASAPVVWAWFALGFSRHGRSLRRPAMAIAYLLTACTVFLAVRGSAPLTLVQNVGFWMEGEVATLRYEPGGWFWVHHALRLGIVITTSWVVVRYLRAHGASATTGLAVSVAAAVASLPTVVVTVSAMRSSVTFAAEPGPVSFAAGTSLLVWALLRRRLPGVGPVARTLIMLELDDPIVVVDGRGRIVDLNRAAEEDLGLKVYSDVPITLGTLWARSRAKPRLREIIELVPWDDPDPAALRSFEVTITSLDERGAPGRSALLLRDVTERERLARELETTADALRQANHELECLARTDGLTGLANRRHFMEAFQRELDRASRYGHELTVLLLDLDHFKSVNDTHGHAAGDAVLRQAARAIEEICRDVDLGARIGGEELAVLLPETDAEGAHALAERLRRKIWQTEHLSPAGTPFRVTTSIGVATSTDLPVTAEALLHTADEALYRAKEGGRNQVAVAS